MFHGTPNNSPTQGKIFLQMLLHAPTLLRMRESGGGSYDGSELTEGGFALVEAACW